MKDTEKICCDKVGVQLQGVPKNLLVPCLLLLLRDLRVHGYQLIQELVSFGFESIDQGYVYRTLRQMEKENLVNSQWDTTSGGPAKRIYSITKHGEDYLSAWVSTLEQYQRTLDRFFQMYERLLFPSNQEKTEVGE
ncbi:MAG TPA: poly-beta-hydroxybutyrate-responsive repressor [Bacillota bacterium]|nr:poly-beta-hydroxybutyrate-responsive repressor [Bacillota bacterium]